ncbi:centrosomal protein of 104 kDa [Anoplophora glabripennis]|uniref:centrosomal protein of 104 kDa n=1 Tax=Anoplophora glabripennis TaxID=217634 RepID=UPI0008756638|nr:centrosomal protein of 104 kDa [Anoplophora glabripennis]
MPKKLDFSVIFATSEDPKYRSAELNIHGPTVKGWQSEKKCEYPQEIILKLERRCVLTKIQLLTHQYLIPSKVEIFLNNEDTNTIENVSLITWEYLGYITLSDNQGTEFKSRELKSANVPKKEATFVKMNLHRNHENIYNINNQVSLIAINFMGMEIELQHVSMSENSTKLNDLINNPDYTSPYDDLAFEMYVDIDIAKVIREMENKKHLAVINERFEYARKLKNTILKLRAAGEKLGKYELEKRHAIEMEDYEKAGQKKSQMDQFRVDIYQELSIEQLLEKEGVCAKNDELHDDADNVSKNLLSPVLSKNCVDKRPISPNPVHTSQISPLHMPRHQSPKSGSPSTGSPTNIQSRGSFRRRNKSAGAIIKSTYEMYEEKPLPALRHSQTNEFLRECQLDSDHKTVSKLTEREKKQAALPILVFGNDLVEKFYSKHYCDKEEGLTRLKEELLSYDNTKMHAPNKTARAAIFLLHRALRDKVFSVYNLANEVIRLFFVQFIPGRVAATEVARSVDKLLPELLTKSGDTSQRVNQMAVHTILTMADCKNVRDLHIIPVHLSRPVSSSTHPRLALSRAEMVEQLIINHGISTDKQSGLTCRTLAEFGSSGLHHPAEAVRKVSERILVLVYKVNPRLVRKQLPPDDDITRRNLLYRQLFHEFDKIDLQRKKEILEKNKILQQNSAPINSCFSPEPTPPEKYELTKCSSSNNIRSMPNIFNYEIDNQQDNNYAFTKNLNQNNGTAKTEHEKQSSSSASGISTPSNNSQKEDEEKQCIFCNQLESVILSVSNSMNSHYWRSCPMLVRCKECSQVVEVATLTEHLLTECDLHENYTQCSQCSEAVKLEEFQQHLAAECKALKEGYNRCPLCHDNLEHEEFCWKKHLMGDNPCQKNTRLKLFVQKQVKIQV